MKRSGSFRNGKEIWTVWDVEPSETFMLDMINEFNLRRLVILHFPVKICV
jgi:hypothetical protein